MATACLSLAIGSGAIADQASGPAVTVSQDEQAIYKAVLKSWLGPESGKQLVNERLSPPPSASAPENAECAKGLNFIEIPAESSKEETLSSATFDGSAIELVDGETWTPTDPEQGIGRGHPVDSAVKEAISRSLISFSQVAFSADRRDALVDFSMACGRLCGTGFTLHMHKSKGEWRTAGRCGGYIS
jgi:hypothetical protein